MAVTDCAEPEHFGSAVGVGESAAAVEEAGHHEHVGDRCGAAVDIGRGGRDLGGDLDEALRVEDDLPHLVVAGPDREGDRERAVVALEDAVLEVAEVATDRAGLRRPVLAVVQGEEPAEVDDPRVLGALLEVDVERFEEVGNVAAAAAGGDHELGSDLGAVVEHHPRHDRR